MDLFSIYRVNAIHLIAPYRWEGTWVFDDPRRGVAKEPLIASEDEIVDRMVAHVSDADDGFHLIFSELPFPGAQFEFDWVKKVRKGHWYVVESLGKDGRFSPLFLKFFKGVPRKIYMKLGERRRR